MPFLSIAKARSRTSLNSPPLAPAFMRNPPPIVPGMPIKNSKPAISLLAAKRATSASLAPAPAMILFGLSKVICVNKPFSFMVIPLMPPSLTSVLEPAPRTWIGISLGQFCSRKTRSWVSAGSNSHSLGPPTPNQVSLSNAAIEVSLPRTFFQLSPFIDEG